MIWGTCRAYALLATTKRGSRKVVGRSGRVARAKARTSKEEPLEGKYEPY